MFKSCCIKFRISSMNFPILPHTERNFQLIQQVSEEQVDLKNQVQV